MSLEVFKAGGLGVGHGGSVQVGVTGDKGDVHEAAILLVHGAVEELRLIQEVIEHLGLGLVDLLHLGEAADGL